MPTMADRQFKIGLWEVPFFFFRTLPVNVFDPHHQKLFFFFFFCCRGNISVYTHAHAQMCQTNERAAAARSEKSRAELRASKRRKTSVENSSQCGAAEQHSSSQPAPQESHLRSSEQVIGMLQPLLPEEVDKQKLVLCWGLSASGAIHNKL